MWRGWSDIAGARREGLPMSAGGLAGPALTALLVLHGALGGIGAWTWLRRLGTGAAAAGGAIMTIAPAAAGLESWHAFVGLAWAPWALLALDAWAAAPSPMRAALSGAGLAAVSLGGGLRTLGAALIVVVPVTLAALIEAGSLHDGRRRRVLWTGVVTLTAVFAAAVVLAPVPPAAPRMPVEALGALILPRSAPGPYVSLLALVAAVAAVALRPRPRTRALAVAAGVGLLTAVAVSGAGLDATRLAMAGLVAEGIAALAATDDEPTRARASAALAAFAALSALGYGLAFVSAATPWNGPSAMRDAAGLGLAAALVSAWTLAGLLDRRDRRAASTFSKIAALVVALDVWMAHAPALEALWREGR